MKILLIGDTNIQDREQPISAFARVRALLDSADLLLGHAEGMFTEEARDRSKPSLTFKDRWRHSTPEMMSAFKEAGFDALCMASNVSAEADAVKETLEVARRYGIPVCGIGGTLREARAPAIVRHGGVGVALLSRTSVFWPNIVPATSTRAGAATLRAYTAYQPGRRVLEMPGAEPIIKTWPDEQDLAALSEDIREAGKRADCVIVSMHWGVSSRAEVFEYQRIIARTAVDAGAALVFGHHPHVVSEFEVYRGAPIFYSLGNFAFDWEKAKNRILDGIVVTAEWDGPGKRIKGFSIRPVSRGEDNLVSELSPDSPKTERITAYLMETVVHDTPLAMERREGKIVVGI